MDEVEVRRGYFPGAIGRVVELHGTYYHTHWGFGAFFEALVASGLAEFFGRYDDRRDGFWTAAVSGRVEGSITIDGIHAADEGAHLRWFILSDALRGRGIGNRLVRAAVDFCRVTGYSRVYLWTFEGLGEASSGAAKSPNSDSSCGYPERILRGGPRSQTVSRHVTNKMKIPTQITAHPHLYRMA